MGCFPASSWVGRPPVLGSGLPPLFSTGAAGGSRVHRFPGLLGFSPPASPWVGRPPVLRPGSGQFYVVVGRGHLITQPAQAADCLGSLETCPGLPVLRTAPASFTSWSDGAFCSRSWLTLRGSLDTCPGVPVLRSGSGQFNVVDGGGRSLNCLAAQARCVTKDCLVRPRR